MQFNPEEYKKLRPEHPYEATAIPEENYLRGELCGPSCVEPIKNSDQLDRLFFPVERHSLFWEDERELDGFYHRHGRSIPHYECPDRYAVVRMDYKHTFTTVAKDYVVVLNEDAFALGMDVAKYCFFAPDNKYVASIHRLTAFGAACEVSIRREIEIGQPQLLMGWRAIVRMGNSYNKTKQLSYTIGFETTSGIAVLFPDMSIVLKDAHSRPIEAIREEVFRVLEKSERGAALKQMEQAFEQLLDSLQAVRMSKEDMLRLFCKVYKLKKTAKNGQAVLGTLQFVERKIDELARENGRNAYTMMLVFGAYINERFTGAAKQDLGRDQLALGKWASEFVEETRKPDFSLHDYFGREISDLVSEYLSR